jgi:exopolysaccharide biosynthesis polyprenyl glycosylphosphotransferase
VTQPSADAWALTLLSLPLWLAILANHGVYRARTVQRFGAEVRCLLHATALGTAATALASLLLKLEVSRPWVVLGFVGATVALVAERAVARAVFSNLRRRGRLTRRVIAVGADADGCELVELLTTQRRLGYQVVGFADDVLPTGAAPVPGVPVLGTTDEVAHLVDATAADGVLVSASALDPVRLNALVRTLGDGGVHVELSNPLRSVAAERLTIRAVGMKFAVMHLAPSEGSRWRALKKRAFDVVLASIGIVLAAPLLLVSAVAIKVDSRGPVLFRQGRVGKDGVIFRVFKLRSMVADAELRLEELRHLNEVQWPLFKVRRDPRTTRVGRLIRTLSIDELPQLWNVLRGEMSLVGPRPALPSEIHGWSPELHRRLRVKPGITGMWQVSGRADASFDDYVHLDLYYVDNWSLTMDLQILLRTVPSVLLQRGAH